MENKKVPFYKDKTISLIPESSWLDKSSLKTRLINKLTRILGISEEELDLQFPVDITKGDFTTNLAMKRAKEAGKSPVDTAEEIIVKIKSNKDLKEYIKEINVAGPGFINIWLNEGIVVDNFISGITSTGEILKGKRIMVEYAHPNPFKAFHIGHLRNIILGESIIRLLEKLGAEVIRTNYQGDVGMHIAKCLWAFMKIPAEQYPSDITKRVEMIAKCYSEGAKAFDDPKFQEEIMEINKKIYTTEDKKINELWLLGKQWSLDKFHEIYKIVDSKFDREYMESETLPYVDGEIKKAKDNGILTESNGALIFDGSKYGINIHVYMNSQGLPTYEGKQLGLVPPMEFKDFGKLDLLIFNVAVEQISYFKSTIKVIELLYPELKGKQYHNAYEFVGLKSGKMSSRTGNVVLGEDIINEAIKKIKMIVNEREALSEEEKAEISKVVGVGAIKYSFLNINPGSYLAFDLDKSLSFEGNSGPYIQYTFTRANKIVDDSKINLKEFENFDNKLIVNLKPQELLLIKRLNNFNDSIIDATKHLAPNILANYLFELSQLFNNYYKFNSILKADTDDMRKLRVYITFRIKETLKEGLRLLGIKVPKLM